MKSFKNIYLSPLYVLSSLLSKCLRNKVKIVFHHKVRKRLKNINFLPVIVEVRNSYESN